VLQCAGAGKPMTIFVNGLTGKGRRGGRAEIQEPILCFPMLGFGKP
jgi:hypothetical protein